MENIKFRVWDNVDYMSKPFTLLDVQRRLTQFTHDCTVMRFTGLKDVNGVEIYEGDIVRIAMDIGATIRAEVMYECGSFWLFSHEIHYVFDEDQDNMIQLGSVCLEGDCYEDGCLKVIDVVGNIHQHPELLEQKQ